MPQVKVYNLEGQETGTAELDSQIFEVKANADLINQVVLAQRANSRINYAHTKTRSEKRGGGRKPWKQKGTGRARHGSNRSPIWTGGGVTFGPRNETNYSKQINKKMKNKALCMVLSDKVENDKLILLEKLEIAENKTKNLAGLLKKLPVKVGPAVLSLAKKNEKFLQATKNMVKVDCLAADSLNVVDLLIHEKIRYLTIPVQNHALIRRRLRYHLPSSSKVRRHQS